MIGLDIEVKNEYNNYLHKIFKDICLSEYDLEIHCDDILFKENNEIKQGLFGTDFLRGEEFFKCISRDNYYMIFVDIKAYPKKSNHIEIQTFEDFLNSECQIVFICTDSGYVELYCKNEKMLHKVYLNCLENKEIIKVEMKSKESLFGRNLVAW